MELEWLVLLFVCFVFSYLLNRIWEDRGSSLLELGCSGHLSSFYHELVKHISPQNVIFPVKMTPLHKVSSCSLREQGVILPGAWMSRTPVFIASWTCEVFVSPKCHFPCQDCPYPLSLVLESGRTGGHPDRGLDVQDTCLHSIIKMSWLEVSLYWLWVSISSRKALQWWWVVKITSAPGPDHLILN